MTTKALYAFDPYLTYCESVVVDKTDEGIILSETVFYPRGGGQAGDSGKLLTRDGETLLISDTRRISEGEHSGRLVHVVADGQHELLSRLKRGDRLHAHIDWDRRLRHMRLHTASHAAGAILGIETDGCSVSSTHARLDFVTSNPIDADVLTQALRQIVTDAKEVTVDLIAPNSIENQPQLRAAVDPRLVESGEAVRIVRIDGLDWQPCAGTHVRNTREIGGVHVKKVEKKSSRTRRVILELIA